MYVVLTVTVASFIFVTGHDFARLARKPKVVLIGLDGATWNAITPMLEHGELPGFKNLMDEGSYGILRSEIPLSPQSWTTIATGMKAEEHGIHYFYTRIPGSVEPFPANALMIKTKTVWQILDENDYSVGTLGWLVTWPPEASNGFTIPGWLAADNSTYPPDLLEELQHNLPLKYVNVTHNDQRNCPYFCDYQEYVLASENADTDNIIAEYGYMANKFQPDVFAMAFYFTNVGQEVFWNYTFPASGYIGPDGRSGYAAAIPDFYKKVDGFISEFVDDPATTLIIVSDHGMGPVQDEADVTIEWANFRTNYNGILEKLGYLKYDSEGVVAWNETKAFSCSIVLENSICINLKGRDRDGAVEQSNYESTKAALAVELKQVRFASNDEPLFSDVVEGDYPEVTLRNFFSFRWEDSDAVLNEDVIIGNGTHKLSEFVRLVATATHYYDGIIFMKGPAIAKGVNVTIANTTDITPTLLYIMGLPVGKDMDGAVLTKAIEPSYLERNPVKRVESYGLPANAGNAYYSSEEVMQKLKSLGYVS